MKKALLITDFSETALQAATYIGQLSKLIGLEKIILYHSYSTVHPDMVMIVDVLVPAPKDLQELHADAIKHLNNVKLQIDDITSKTVTIECFADDQPIVSAVNEFIKLGHADFVVMGICGKGNSGKNNVGSITAKLIKERLFPLLIIPANFIFTSVQKLMLACDLKSVEDQLPAVTIVDLAKRLKARLYVVNVDHSDSPNAAAILHEEQKLHDVFDQVDASYKYLDNTDMVAGLTNFIDSETIDLVIAVPKPRGWFETLFHESATKKLAVNTPIPLLILKN